MSETNVSQNVLKSGARKKKKLKRGLTYAFLLFVGFFMVYPLVWLFFSVFKTNTELFGKLTYIERKNRPDNELAFITPTMVESTIDEKLTELSRSAMIMSKIRLL